MRLAILVLAMALQSQMELGAAEDCCTQVMITPVEWNVEGYASLASYNQAFNSSFNIIGYNTEKDAPNYQAGNFCIVAEDHPWILNFSGWVVRDCDSGRKIADHFRRPLPKCLEEINRYEFTEEFRSINVNTVCVTEAASDTTEVVTTEPEVVTTEMELGAAEDCCEQIMMIPVGDVPSEFTPVFNSVFNITGYSNETNTPNYRLETEGVGTICIEVEENHWQMKACGASFAFMESSGDQSISRNECFEGTVDWSVLMIVPGAEISADIVCVTGPAESGGAPSDTTEVETTEPEAPTMQVQETTKKPCEPCRDVLDGALAGYYELQSKDDPRCDDGCSYTNQQSQEFCFRPGGFETKLECREP
jgi:hypothetical protein